MSVLCGYGWHSVCAFLYTPLYYVRVYYRYIDMYRVCMLVCEQIDYFIVLQILFIELKGF